MKKIIALLSLVTVFQLSYAQDFKKVQANVLLNKFELAKEEYDKAITKKPALSTATEAYYWKARIFAAISKDAAISSKYPDAYAQMTVALEEYMKGDSKFELAKANGQEPFFDVYFKSFKDGVTSFNEKDWKKASAHFDVAVKFSDIVFSQGWATSKQKFDTTSLMYAGYSNQNASNLEAAIVYYKRLVDANIHSSELVDVYRFLLLQFINKKDKENFDKYLKLSQEGYPAENWVEFKSEFIEKSLTIEEKIKLFDESNAAGTLTEYELQMFGDMFMAGRNEEGISPAKADSYFVKAAEAYKKAYTMNTKNFAAAFNVGISYYNQYSLLDDKFGENIRALQALNSNKPAAPKDPKKKLIADAKFKAQVDSIKSLNAALEGPIKEKVDAAIEWIEKSYNSLKDKEKLERTEKSVMARSVDFLANLYGYKRDRLRGKDQKASDEYDAKFNFFDKLHDKYQ